MLDTRQMHHIARVHYAGVARSPTSPDLPALHALYAEVDAVLDGWSCEQSTDCCHFRRTGREPYLWPNEWALLEEAIARRGGVRVVAPRKSPKKPRSLRVVRDEGACPLLGPDDRCTVYAARPFGCRTFFCDRALGPTRRPPRDALSALGRRLAALAEKTHPDGPGPRALTSLLTDRPKR